MSTDVRRYISGPILADSVFRVESALTIALTVLLAYFVPSPLPWWRWWFWLILGSVSEALIVYTSVLDEAAAHSMAANLLEAHHDPAQIWTPRYRQQIERTLESRRLVAEAVRAQPARPVRGHPYATAAAVAEWVRQIYELARHLDVYERDELLRRRINEASAEVDRWRRTLASERSATVKAQIQTTLASKETEAANLQALQERMVQARTHLEDSVTALTKVADAYQRIIRRPADGEARRLAQQSREQAALLEVTLTAVDRVYGLGG